MAARMFQSSSAGSQRARKVQPVVRVSMRQSTPHSTSDQAVAKKVLKAVVSVAAAGLLSVQAAHARLEGVNKPELLPNSFTTVIDAAGFLTAGEEKRLAAEIEGIERDTGIKLRVLAQNYPNTPGLAVREYWGVDDSTVVFVADPTFGGILNFNVGKSVDLEVPRSFWTRLAGKYGSKFYWQEKGEGATIMNTVSAIDTCLREPQGKLKCSAVQGDFEEKPSSGSFGKFFFGS